MADGLDCRVDRDLPTDVAALAAQMGAVQRELGGMRQAVERVSEAIVRIAVVDERQLEFGRSLDRLFTFIEKVDAERKAEVAALSARLFTFIERVDAERRAEEKALSCRLAKLEKAQPEHKRVAAWVDRALWAAAGAAVLFVAKATGLL